MSINIGVGDKVKNDRSYRYKMPALQTKIEGRGNGIKTVIVNIVDVSKALHINPEYTTKFFGIEYGAMSSYDKKTDKAVINGAFQASEMQKTLEGFISNFILCPNCKLPEIRMTVKSSIKIDCAACPFNGPLPTTHKLASFIIKNPPVREKKKGAHTEEDKEAQLEMQQEEDEKEELKKERRVKRQKGAKGKDDEEDVEWFTDVSEEAVRKRKEEEFALQLASMENMKKFDNILEAAGDKLNDKKSNAPTILKIFLAAKERTVDEIVGELRRLQLARDFDEPNKLKVFLEGAIDVSDPKKVTDEFVKQAKVLKAMCSDAQKSLVLIYVLEDFFGVMNPKLLPRIPLVFQQLYEHEVLEEDVIKQWYSSPPEANWLVQKEVGAAVRLRSKAFVDWLDQGDEEEEDDE